MRPDQSSARGARVVLTTLAVALVAAIAATPASAAPSTGLVVNEVYGGGGNSGATYTNDFVEIANRGSSPVDVSGWSVQYHAATGTGAWQVTPLSGSIAPGQLYLVAEAAGAGGTTPLPTPQVTGTIPMAAASGTIALVNGTAALTCQDSAACQSASVDLVGYGSTAAINESAPAPGGASTTSCSATARRTPTTTPPTSPPPRRPRRAPTTAAEAQGPARPARCASTTSRAPRGSRRTTTSR